MSLCYPYCGGQLCPGLADLVMQATSGLVAGVCAGPAPCLASKRQGGGPDWWQPGRRGVGEVPQDSPQLASPPPHIAYPIFPADTGAELQFPVCSQ